MRSHLFLIAGLILLLRCGQTIPERHYYLLDYPILPGTVHHIKSDERFAHRLPFIVQMGMLTIPKIFDRSNITVRYTTTQLNYYRYHLWALRPDENIRDLIYRHILAADIFEEFRQDYTRLHPELEIRGDIISLERYEYRDEKVSSFSAHLEMRIMLVNLKTGQIRSEHYFNRNETLYQAEMNRFVLTLSQIIKEETDAFIKKILDTHASPTSP
ncbi:MAG: membrane integrity-associated transporter subunit PqiC [Candidatus Delongbacteria bacterium]|nr:membrane integrity-associated transporter subunit PqiC [Candidatus Delongbacteria bacterium]